jgi:AraC-like DNA-binding protein/DNA gyrase inhibitor GyrI
MSQATASNHYTERINLVLDHVSAHLTSNLSLNALADVAGFSPFHFHRLFRALTGETLNAFVTRKRLERAAQLMRGSPGASITAIALECGFSAPSDFTRTFKKQYGLAPSQWDRVSALEESKIRNADAGLPLYTRAAMDEMTQRGEFEVVIRDCPAQPAGVIRVEDPYRQPERIVAAYARLCAWADAHGPRGTLIGMSQDDPDVTPIEHCRYDVCMTARDGMRGDEAVTMKVLPTCTLACIHCVGDIVLVDRAWQYLYRHWLPNSRYLPGNLPAMEIYVKAPDEIGWTTFDLDCCLPIVPM